MSARWLTGARAMAGALWVLCFFVQGCGVQHSQAGGDPVDTVRSDGAVLLHAPRPPASTQNPLLLPDGASMVFTQFHRGYNEGPAGLFRRAEDGTVQPLMNEPDCDSVNMPGSAYCRRTARLAFGSDRREREEIWTVALAGAADPQRVTRHAGADAFREPTFSPDGRWIVFERHQTQADDEDERVRGSLWKVRTDGTALTRLTEGPAGGFDDRQPNWSPAGDDIVFQRRRRGQPWRVCVLHVASGRVRPVTDGAADATDPSWSPDARRIVFSSDVGEETASLYVVSSQGGGAHRLTRASGCDDAAPCWSPDGRHVAFESRPTRGGPAFLWRIAVTR